MPASPNSPRLVRAAIVTLDPDTSVLEAIALQYNPDLQAARWEAHRVESPLSEAEIRGCL
jgi:hypothetical protein